MKNKKWKLKTVFNCEINFKNVSLQNSKLANRRFYFQNPFDYQHATT